ncbi:MAG: type I restriction enzyme HsdR N-terminal domain-containing protein [Candidatus Eisenbacteria sp.]|nr:type I restriction enzyme HsdR N-terminal domain-containing protein [Candidatus Eisenbacteria bacterium]
MGKLETCIGNLQKQIERHRRAGLKEYPTRTIFIDPMLEALGWDVRDPDDVELEYPTIDNKSVDYALKINKKPVLLLEAKQLKDRLEDVKAITQVVGYAANDNVGWCVLTNGVRYKVYKTSEEAPAPEKIMFEVSIDPRDSEGVPVEQLASQLSRISKDSVAQGHLDIAGERVFTTAKVRKALDKLFNSPSDSLVRLVRKTVGPESISLAQVRTSLPRIWSGVETPITVLAEESTGQSRRTRTRGAKEGRDYGEAHHTQGEPSEVVEIYRALDRFCMDLSTGEVVRRHKMKYVSWSKDKWIFCCAHLRKSGLRVWLKLDPGRIPGSATYARDVSSIGHWGVGDVELAIDSLERLGDAKQFIQASFEAGPK